MCLQLGAVQKDTVKVKRKGVKMDRVHEELKVAKTKFKMDPVELVALIKDLRRYMRLAHKAKTEMVEAQSPVSNFIAKKYTNRGLSFLDLIQEGNMELMKAVEKFEYRRVQILHLCDLGGFAKPLHADR